MICFIIITDIIIIIIIIIIISSSSIINLSSSTSSALSTSSTSTQSSTSTATSHTIIMPYMCCILTCFDAWDLRRRVASDGARCEDLERRSASVEEQLLRRLRVCEKSSCTVERERKGWQKRNPASREFLKRAYSSKPVGSRFSSVPGESSRFDLITEE